MDESYLIKADKNSTARYLKTLVDSGIITRNEARKQLGYNEMDGCDDLIVPFTNIKDNTIGSKQENSEKEGENKNNINIKDE
nr:MAG TPA: portal protein [Caudoviricetes sp.]